jgi:6-phosphogluconolactonase (cycloisomerase 2 family)
VTFSLDGSHAFVTNLGSDNISVYAVSPSTGVLTAEAFSPVASSDRPWSMVIEPQGDFAYVANGGTADEITGYSVNPVTGNLTPLAGFPVATGREPFAIVAVELP